MNFNIQRFIAVATACGVTMALNCREITIPVDVSADNRILPANLTAADLTPDFILNTVANLTVELVGGQFDISARYCEPTTIIGSRQNSLQVLIPGVSYTKNYWSGLAPPDTLPGQDEYSWIIYAAGQGYPTLSIDRLCTGDSSKPNSLVCQVPIQMEALHEVIVQARAGLLPSIGTSFDQIIVTGHSLGSVLGAELTRNHPEDTDVLLLLGFSFNLFRGAIGLTMGDPAPAALLDPQYATLDLGYLQVTNREAFERLFYFRSYEESVVDYDFENTGLTSLGELATFAPVSQVPDPDYERPLFVLNGNEDALFCQVTLAGPIGIGPPPNCSSGFSEQVSDFYPSVSAFGFYNTPDTGHCLNLHTTAQESFAAAHQFLEAIGF